MHHRLRCKERVLSAFPTQDMTKVFSYTQVFRYSNLLVIIFLIISDGPFYNTKNLKVLFTSYIAVSEISTLFIINPSTEHIPLKRKKSEHMILSADDAHFASKLCNHKIQHRTSHQTENMQRKYESQIKMFLNNVHVDIHEFMTLCTERPNDMTCILQA